jgi:hypothetical protein
MSEETIIVEITGNVRLFEFQGRNCMPGDKVAIPKRLFRADFMRLIADVKVEGMKTMVPTPLTADVDKNLEGVKAIPKIPAPDAVIEASKEEEPKTEKKGKK